MSRQGEYLHIRSVNCDLLYKASAGVRIGMTEGHCTWLLVEMLTTQRGGGERTPIQITEFVPARTLMEEIVFAVTGNIFPQFGKKDKKKIYD